jgi:short-subunit dehydrogenase
LPNPGALKGPRGRHRSHPFRRALVTGATGGIGEAFATCLAETSDLLLTGRDAERLAAAQERLSRPGRTIETIVADLSEPAGRNALVARAEAFELDLLVNNAGVGRFGRFLDSPPGAETDTALVNVVAVVDLTHRLLPGMRTRAQASGGRAGVIIVASTAAFAPVPFLATYAASKAFDLQFAEALAEEVRGEPIDVVALCPGATRSRFAARAGFDRAIPGAADPMEVARDGLAALGRDTVRLSGLVNQAALGPAVLPRRLMTGAIGLAMRMFAPRG